MKELSGNGSRSMFPHKPVFRLRNGLPIRVHSSDVAGIVAFALFLAVISYLGNSRKADWLKEYKASVQVRLNATGFNLATGIDRRVSLLGATVAMAEMLLETGTLGDEFELYATGFHANDPAIRAIELFPLQGKAYVYPVKGNEAVLHMTFNSLLSDASPVVRREIERTILSGKPTLSDPFPLFQGPIGVVAQQAIHRDGKLWGIAAIVIDLDILLDVSGFGKGNPDLQFALADSSDVLFLGEKKLLDSDPIHCTIPLPEGYWTLHAAPIAGWSAGIGSRLSLLRLTDFLLSLLFALIIWFIRRRHEFLTTKISDQDRDIEENRQRLQIAVEASNIGFFDYDIASGKVIRSPEYERQIGYEPGEMPPDNTCWVENIHPEDKEATLNASIECIEGRKSEYEVEYRFRHKDGSWRWILDRGKVLTDPSGKV
ncbi:MAG: PAS domain-containing protein, partial [Rectinemataceae bacterium]|nr:PAS domain-containing protein [Rectinemataceae bacterium]